MNIHIAANRRYRCNLPESIQNLRIPHIACMQNLFRLGQSHQGLRPQQAMRI